MSDVDQVIVHSNGNYQFEYDKTNTKLKVFSVAPPIVYDEKITQAGSGASLMYPMAWPLFVCDEVGNPQRWILAGNTTPGGHEYCLVEPIRDGARTGVSPRGTGNYYVSYITQAWRDVYALLEQNQVVVLQNSGASCFLTSGQTIYGIGAIKSSGTTVFAPIDYKDTAGTTEMAVAFMNSGTTASYLRPAEGYGGKQVYITYLKRPTSGSWLDRHTVTGTTAYQSGVSIMYFDQKVLAWLQGGAFISYGDNTNYLTGVSAVVNKTGIVKMVPQYVNTTPGTNGTNVIRDMMYGYNFADPSAGVTPTHHTYIRGLPSEIPNLQLLEVPNGTDLSNLTGVKVIMIGR